jgi:hypothetical protein
LSYASHHEAVKITNIPSESAFASAFSAFDTGFPGRSMTIPDEIDRVDGRNAGRARSNSRGTLATKETVARRVVLPQGVVAENRRLRPRTQTTREPTGFAGRSTAVEDGFLGLDRVG